MHDICFARTARAACGVLVSLFVAITVIGCGDDALSPDNDAAGHGPGSAAADAAPAADRGPEDRDLSAEGAARRDGGPARDARAKLDCSDPKIHFCSGFSGVRICDEDGECAKSPLRSSYYECSDSATHVSGTDSDTGDRWPSYHKSAGDMPGNAIRNYFQEVVINGPPDCCASGCTASRLSQCHVLEIARHTQHDGTRGNVLVLEPLKDCSSKSYSRLQYVMGRASSGKPWERFSAFYYEVWMRFPNLHSAFKSHAGLAELYMSSGWKLAIVMQMVNGKPTLRMKNGSNRRAYHDSACVPEQNVWFKLRVWYKAGQSDGRWKSTFTCPNCSPPVPETVIKEWRGRTQQSRETPATIAPLKNALSYGLELQLDDFKFGEYSVAP